MIMRIRTTSDAGERKSASLSITISIVFVLSLVSLAHEAFADPHAIADNCASSCDGGYWYGLCGGGAVQGGDDDCNEATSWWTCTHFCIVDLCAWGNTPTCEEDSGCVEDAIDYIEAVCEWE